MASEPEDYLTFADRLLRDDTMVGEAVYRTIISRAYYAIFLFARDLLEREGTRLRGGGERSHTDVWEYLLSTEDSNGVSLGQQGNDLRAARTIADYRFHRNVSLKDAETVVLTAEHLLSEMKLLSPA
jgi:uncharacterized protein (UPF0332 family)